MTRKESARKRDQQRPRSNAKDQKTCKQLLGELYADKEYLEKLLQDAGYQSYYCYHPHPAVFEKCFKTL